MLGEYTIKIQLIDNETEEIVGKREIGSVEIAKQVLEDIEKWINDWEKMNYDKCCQCNRRFRKDAMSEPNNPDWKDKLICQDCLEKIMIGEQKLKV